MEPVEMQQVLDEFFRTETRKVIAIKGKWGVGKTYFWKKYLKEHNNQLKYRAASYVSLFGLDSLKEIKQTIIAKAALLGDKKTIKQGFKTYQYVSPLLQQLPKVKDLSPFLQQVESLLIQKFIVCLDDLERRSAKLSLDQVFGFVSLLKEENDCRVVLILNEGELNDDDSKILAKYREKVIDLEVTYAPSVATNTELIASQDKHEQVFEVVEALSLNNIRIIQHAVWNVERFEALSLKQERAVKNHLSRNVAIFTCIHESNGSEIDLEKFRSINPVSSYFLKKKGRSFKRNSNSLNRQITSVEDLMNSLSVI
jgi:hypothetical protein